MTDQILHLRDAGSEEMLNLRRHNFSNRILRSRGIYDHLRYLES